ncbi:MAG: homogentisate 1,2-dioxygenase [Gammaproteobacteria bacterium]
MANSRWISFPRSEGQTSRQAHADLPANSYERELGKEGFFGPATHMYHRHLPTGWSHVTGACLPRAFDTKKLDAEGASPWNAVALVGNVHMRVRFWHCTQSMDHLVRNADGDDLLFVHQGGGDLYCDYGHLTFRDGDYILMPRGTMWRLEISEATSLLLIEASNSSYKLPEKGILGDHAIFDPAVLDVPAMDEAFRDQQSEEEWRVSVKRRGELGTITYPFNPLDALGWHGTLAPVRLNWRDIRPIMSHRYHIPPSVHTTFVADRFVVCTFVPRPIETDPGALKVPFFHNNDDYDEVIFYHRGEFFSRDNIHPGMMTVHPAGITHGPHPKALATGEKAAREQTDEVAVMIDTRDALEVAAPLAFAEWKGYVDSWKSDGG